ncbi:MAG TPA: carbon starvation protein A [Armatimonadetes bacterium]|nr:carbon starvation protein A [Armatimonadota bacterium]
MNSAFIALVTLLVLYCGYRWYGGFIEKHLVQPDPARETPAHAQYDGVDFYPAKKILLFGHHFSSIAGAGPIVGPILAVAAWGWGAVLAWVILGGMFIGGLHDYLTLMVSARNRGVSIGELSERVMGRTARTVFSLFLLLALILVIAVFGVVAAKTLIKQPEVVVPTFSLILIAIFFGWLAYVRGVSLAVSTPIAVLMMFGAIYLGYLHPLWLPSEVLRPELTAGRQALAQAVQALEERGISSREAQALAERYPLDTIRRQVESLPFREEGPSASVLIRSIEENWALPEAYQKAVAQEENRQVMFWFWMLMAYCLFASALPVWLLLQPRDYINTYKLFIGLFLGYVGVLAAGQAMQAPFFTSFREPGQGLLLWPMLFVITACGAVSGFHSLVSSGTTVKQLNQETEARFIGYGAMLWESALGVLALLAVGAGLYWSGGMGIATNDVLSELVKPGGPGPLVAFARGYGRLVGRGLPLVGFTAATLFGMIMLKTFVLTSLDTCTRLARFVLVELCGHWHPLLRNRWVAGVLVLIPAAFLGATNSYKIVWPVFGSANQLMAALALLVVSCYLVGVRRPSLYSLGPGMFMLLTTIGALIFQSYKFTTNPAGPQWTLATLSLILVILAGFVAKESVRSLQRLGKGGEAGLSQPPSETS